MKKIFTFGCALTALAAQAQVLPVDTLSDKQLDEVVVDAQLQRAGSNVTTYYPDKNAKRTALNVADLLTQIGIPQIEVEPTDGTVKTHSGEEVAIYIDMQPATEDEKNGLRAEDVKKVEYLVFPSDQRFNHKKYVINITLKHQNLGGYTKLTAKDNLMIGSAYGLLYSKLDYKNMTYDLSVGDHYKHNHHMGSEQTQLYRFPQSDGTVDELSRTSLSDDSYFKQNRLGGIFRAKYSTEKTTISNTVSLITLRTPHNNYGGKLLLSNSLNDENAYENLQSSSSLNPGWNGEYYFKFNKGFSLYTESYLSYQHTKSDRNYTSDLTSILTKANEDAVTGGLDLNFGKNFSEHHSLSLDVGGIYQYNDVKYTGNTDTKEIFKQMAANIGLVYSFNTEKLSGNTYWAFVAETNKVNGRRINNNYLAGYFNVQYAINEKNSLTLFGNRFVYSVEADVKAPDVIQENEWLYKTGNMLLNNTPGFRGTISYTWLPCNMFSMSVHGGYMTLRDRVTPVYNLTESGDALLRTYENDGDYETYQVGGSFTGKFFKRKLVLQATPCYHYTKLTGIYAEDRNDFTFNMSATYYLGKFYFSGSYKLASTSLLEYDMDNISARTRNHSLLRAGWSNGKWNIRVDGVNLFRSDWKEQTSRLDSSLFSKYTTTYGIRSHRCVAITASYIFNYGKKVKPADEVEAGSSAKSAIMH